MERYNGNNAYRIKIQEREEQKLVRRDNPRYEEFIKKGRKEIISSICVIMAVALVIALRVAQISVMNSEIQSAQKKLKEAEAVCSNLEIERDRRIDLSNIEKIATNDYGMTTPNKDQIIYISVLREDTVKSARSDWSPGRLLKAGEKSE